MKEAIKAYVDNLFKGAPQTSPVTELHDEILINLEERYDDCINAGMTPQRAYAAVIGTMGDVTSLIEQVSGTGFHEEGLFEKKSPRGRLFKKYAYIFREDNLKIIRNTAITVMWLLIVVLYFLISFSTYDWEYSWLVFIVGAGLNVAISMISSVVRITRGGDSSEIRVKLLKRIRGGASALLWLVTVFFFFVFSFSCGYDDPTWLIFILAAAVQVIMNAVFKIQINRYS